MRYLFQIQHSTPGVPRTRRGEARRAMRLRLRIALTSASRYTEWLTATLRLVFSAGGALVLGAKSASLPSPPTFENERHAGSALRAVACHGIPARSPAQPRRHSRHTREGRTRRMARVTPVISVARSTQRDPAHRTHYERECVSRRRSGGNEPAGPCTPVQRGCARRAPPPPRFFALHLPHKRARAS